MPGLRIRLAAVFSRAKPLGVAILFGLSILNAFAQSAFTDAGVMINPRLGATATLLKDGRVLIAGGDGVQGDVLQTAELYDPSTGTFTLTGSMTTPRNGGARALLSDGRVLIAGGNDVTHYVTSAELYDPATGTFAATGDLNSLHIGFTYDSGGISATSLSDGRVLITGGGTAEIYDPKTGVFTSAGQVVDRTVGAVLLKDGRVLIPGKGVSVYGVDRGAPGSLQLQATYHIDNDTQTATLLMNGQVLISGGYCVELICKASDESFVYDPHGDGLRSVELLAIPRIGHTATLLPGGHVLIAGGLGPDYDSAVPCVQDAEEYDPSTGTFKYAGSELFMNCLPTATLLLDGRVLLTGGLNSTFGAEIYTPPLRAASAASLTGPLARESVASVFGSRLASTTVSADPMSPSTSLGGISLRVLDSAGAAALAPLFMVSPTEIRFEVPAGTALGNATLEIVNAPVQQPSVATQVGNVAPGIFTLDDNMVAGQPAATSLISPKPSSITLGLAPADFSFYATGVRNRSSLGNVKCTIGGTSVPVTFAGPDPSGDPGLDQVTIHVPADFPGRGVLDLVLTVDGATANTVSIEMLGLRAATPTIPQLPPSGRTH